MRNGRGWRFEGKHRKSTVPTFALGLDQAQLNFNIAAGAEDTKIISSHIYFILDTARSFGYERHFSRNADNPASARPPPTGGIAEIPWA
jgi:hypothetical protein